jgi:hypothetical protein
MLLSEAEPHMPFDFGVILWNLPAAVLGVSTCCAPSQDHQRNCPGFAAAAQFRE